MALLTPSQAEPPPSSASWRRWLNPRDPRGTTLWGTTAMSVAWWALYAIHGSPSEVWPNRCALLRAQLQAEPRYALTASEVSPPPLFEGLALERAHLLRGASGLARVVFEGRELNAEGSVTQVSAQLTTLPSDLIERLISALDLPFERSAWLPSDQPLLDQSPLDQSPFDQSPAALTRLGLSTTPQALSCAPELRAQELPLALGLLLKGGVISPLTSLETAQVGRWGTSGWWMREGKVARFWSPLSASPASPQSSSTAQEPHRLIIWQRRPQEGVSSSRGEPEPLLLADTPQDTASLAQRLVSATTPSAVEALLGGEREERPQ